MRSPAPIRRSSLAATLAVAALAIAPAPLAAQEEDFSRWEILRDPFPSTGGGGIMIGGYAPAVTGPVCATDFTATEPDGAVHRNRVEFDAVPTQGGVLCANGRWRSLDGNASGTTPFRVFFKEGVVRRSP
jgi:hypothetical protein